MRKEFWLGNWGMRAAVAAVFMLMACPGRMVSEVQAMPAAVSDLIQPGSGTGTLSTLPVKGD